MPQASVGGNVRYPNLQLIADSFRNDINDSFNNAGGTGTGFGGGAGLVMPNSNPNLLNYITRAVFELYGELRNIGDPELILDNYILVGLPALTQPNPSVQVSLGYMGFFDGFQWHANWTLPISTSKVLALWERQTNSGLNFNPMKYAPFGIGGCQQGLTMNVWEMRQGQIWMPGATQSIDLRIRARIGFPPLLNPATIDFNTAYIPILDSLNAIVAKMVKMYARRFAPEQYPMALQEDKDQMEILSLAAVRQLQLAENQREPFGEEAVQDFAIAWSWL